MSKEVRQGDTFLFILRSIVSFSPIDPEIIRSLSLEEWIKLYHESVLHGLTAVVYSQLKPYFDQSSIPSDLKRTWRIHSLSIERQMAMRHQICYEFAEKMNDRGLQVMALKGVAYASYYPNQNHRECGDLDCYMMGKKEEGDSLIVEIGGRKEDVGDKHSHLFYKGLTIENHKYFTNFNNTDLGRYTENALKNLAKEGYENLGDSKLLNPHPDFTALFLVKHAQRHFLYEGIRLRHVLDWAFFLKKEQARVNWDVIIQEMKQCKILNFAIMMTSICVNELGVKVQVASLTQIPTEVEAIRDIFKCDIMGTQPEIHDKNIIKKIYRISRRLYRMWRFRVIADESYFRMLYNVFAYSSLGGKTLQL